MESDLLFPKTPGTISPSSSLPSSSIPLPLLTCLHLLFIHLMGRPLLGPECTDAFPCCSAQKPQPIQCPTGPCTPVIVLSPRNLCPLSSFSPTFPQLQAHSPLCFSLDTSKDLFPDSHVSIGNFPACTNRHVPSALLKTATLYPHLAVFFFVIPIAFHYSM